MLMCNEKWLLQDWYSLNVKPVTTADIKAQVYKQKFKDVRTALMKYSSELQPDCTKPVVRRFILSN